MGTVKRILVLFTVAAFIAVVMGASSLPAYALDDEYSHNIADGVQCYDYCVNSDYFGNDSSLACSLSCGYAPPDYTGPTDPDGNPVPLPPSDPNDGS